MNRQDFTLQRNRELYNVFKEVYSSCSIETNMFEIYKAVATHEASRFYVSEEEACNNVFRIVKGMGVKSRTARRKKMYHEIAKRAVKRYKQFDGKKFRECISEVVNEPAPEFYLHPASVRTILACHRKQLREKNRIKRGIYLRGTRINRKRD